MSASAQPASVPSAGDTPGDRFLASLPRVERHARVYFRFLPPDRREEAVAETVALAWHWFLRLAERGKDASGFVSALASFAARAVAGGRRLCGQLPAQDVLSEAAQRRHGFRVEALPCTTRRPFDDLHTAVGGQRQLDAFEELLQDNAVTPVVDQVVFRVDFPDWRRTRTYRDRRLMDALMVGERTCDVGRKFGLTPGRVSQLRREFHDDWLLFTGDLPATHEGTEEA
jgi:hypothetical protein